MNRPDQRVSCPPLVCSAATNARAAVAAVADSREGACRATGRGSAGRAAGIRILFRFDPRKTGILLIGGDKQGLWDEWYKKMIPLAEKLYEDYLEELRKEGPLK